MTICPLCNSQDAVQKVTALVSAGTYQTTYNVPAQGQLAGHTVYGTVQQTGIGKTELAQKISPPSDKDWEGLQKRWRKEPTQNVVLQEYLKLHPSPGEEKNETLKSVFAFVGMFLFLLGTPIAASLNWLMGILVAIVAVFFMAVIPSVIYKRSNTQEFMAWNEATHVYQKQIIPNLRKKARANYERLYYCHRDDVVYIPGTNYMVKADVLTAMSGWIDLGRLDS